MVEVSVENIVVSFTISSSLDLSELAGILPDATYNPDDVPAIVIRFSKPHSMATLFSTGNVVVTGPKSMDEVYDVVKMVTNRLNVVGVPLEETPEIKVMNVTVSTDLHQSLKLRRLAKFLQAVEYNRKVFPGLVYKGDDPNTVILLFDSGKIVCNGIRLEDVTVALDKMLEKLLSFGIKKEENVCQK
jgi:transcription initiation factor TFIID TATA-box-binding protein